MRFNAILVLAAMVNKRMKCSLCVLVPGYLHSQLNDIQVIHKFMQNKKMKI